MTTSSDVEYLTLAAGAFASWMGVPGPGEPLLIAAGILAAKQKLALADTLLIAFAAANAGGIAGWIIGKKAGRRVLERPGPLYRLRIAALARGEEVFSRWPAAAVLLTMSWIAGIHRVSPGTFIIWNGVGAAVWTAGIGLGAYFVGPAVIDVVGDTGWLSVFGIVGLVAAGVAIEFGWRRRKRREV